jgi:hypothetical protein
MDKLLGCLGIMAIFLTGTALIACVPAIPLWLMGHTLAGGLVYVFVGLPVGSILTIFFMAVIFSKDKGDDDGGDDPKPEPEPVPEEEVEPPKPVNRLSRYFNRSTN